jgi:hypothetical protein
LSLYTALQARAQAILTRLGQTVTLISAVAGTYDPATSSAAVSTTDVPRKAAIFPFSSGQSMVRGEMVEAGDRQCIMDGVGIAPTVNDQVVSAAGESFKIVSIQEIAPDGTTVIYDIHLRAN